MDPLPRPQQPVRPEAEYSSLDRAADSPHYLRVLLCAPGSFVTNVSSVSSTSFFIFLRPLTAMLAGTLSINYIVYSIVLPAMIALRRLNAEDQPPPQRNAQTENATSGTGKCKAASIPTDRVRSSQIGPVRSSTAHVMPRFRLAPSATCLGKLSAIRTT